jgi:hypothetical protein
MAELIAAYSPPIPVPVKNRQAKYQIGLIENAVSTVATVYTAKVSMNSFLRPNRSVS